MVPKQLLIWIMRRFPKRWSQNIFFVKSNFFTKIFSWKMIGWTNILKLIFNRDLFCFLIFFRRHRHLHHSYKFFFFVKSIFHENLCLLKKIAVGCRIYNRYWFCFFLWHPQTERSRTQIHVIFGFCTSSS